MTIRQTLVEEFVTWAAAIPAEQNITQHPEFHARRRALSDAEIKAAIDALRSTAEAKFAEARELEAEGRQRAEPQKASEAANDQTMPMIRSAEQMRGCVDALKELIQSASWTTSYLVQQRIELVGRAAFEWMRENVAKREGAAVDTISDDAVLAAFARIAERIRTRDDQPDPLRSA